MFEESIIQQIIKAWTLDQSHPHKGSGELRLCRKSGGEVAYTVTPELWQLLMKHIEEKDPDDFVFEINGKPITTDRLYKVWTSACIKAKVKHISLQQASRHSTATEIYAEYKKKALREIERTVGA